MADQKISELTALTGANVATDDEFVIVDTSGVATKRITMEELLAAIAALETPVIEADSVMAFGQSAAPTGWTRLTTGDTIYDAATNNAMLCFAKTGDIAQGGSVDPQAAHLHQWYVYTDAVTAGKSYDSDGAERDITNTNDVPNGVVAGAVAGNYRLNQDCYTTKNTAPYYVEMILAKKD